MRSAQGPQWRQAFGARLRELRQARGLSQEALAFAAGITPNYEGDVERGARNLGLENICALAEALGVSPAAFFEDAERRGC